MKIIRISIAVMAIVMMGICKGYGQQPDSVKRRSVTYYSRFLKTDTATARQVSDLQDRYKKALIAVTGNGLLTEQRKRSAIDSLMNEKNRRLEELLPADQRNMMIPTTERKRTWKRDTMARTNH